MRHGAIAQLREHAEAVTGEQHLRVHEPGNEIKSFGGLALRAPAGYPESRELSLNQRIKQFRIAPVTPAIL